MKLFVKKVLFWFLPVALLYLAAEVYISVYPNNFNTRAAYIQNNADVSAVFFGSSHTQYGLNPEFLEAKTANLAYSGQDYQIDNALFFKYVPRLRKLKYVFLEFDYFSLEEKIPHQFFKIPWYYKHHGFQIEPVSFLNKISLYSSSPTFFNRYLADKLNPFSESPAVNRFGFTVHDNTGDFFTLNFDSLKIEKSAAKRLKDRHAEESIKNYTFNKAKLEEILTYCKAHDLQVVLVKFPVFKTYRERYNPKKLMRSQKCLDSLKKAYDLTILDFESDSDFNLNDFKDDDHLNESGAEKLTKKINLFLNKNKTS